MENTKSLFECVTDASVVIYVHATDFNEAEKLAMEYISVPDGQQSMIGNYIERIRKLYHYVIKTT